MITFGKDLSVDENALSFIREEQELSPSSAIIPGENMKAILGIEEQSQFEQTSSKPKAGAPSIKEGTQVAGSGVSVQTERGLLESGAHPDEELQRTWDDRKKKPEGYKDTGETQTQTYERVMGEEAGQKKKQNQEEKRKKLFEELQKQKEIYDKKTFLEKVSSTWDTFMGTDEASKEKMTSLGMDLLQTTPAGAVAGITKKTIASLSKYFNTDDLEKIVKPPEFKSRTKTILMPIDEFLSLAKPLKIPIEEKTKRLKEVVSANKSFSDLPFLTVSHTGDVAHVTGHEGRHRALLLKEEGEKFIPVNIISDRIRWSEQTTGRFDYIEDWPTKLISESGEKEVPFPIKRD